VQPKVRDRVVPREGGGLTRARDLLSSPARVPLRGGAVTFAITDFGYILVLEPGDELIRCLIQFARSQEVDAAVLAGTGTVAEVELGAGRTAPSARRRVAERLEACSLTGTLTLVDGEPFPSLRGSFARADCSLIGGQVFEAVCDTSVELAIQIAAAAPGGAGAATHGHIPLHGTRS
jgi:predicted DNA-binding protein with PD1-like motif